MKITILTLFPEMFEGFLETSIIKRAIGKGIVEIKPLQIRDFTKDKYGRTDTPPPGTLRFLSAENSFSGKMSFGNGAVVEAIADGALPVIDGKVTMPTLSATARLRLRCRTAASPDGWTQEHVNQYLASDIRDRCVLDVPVGETFDLGMPTPGSYCAAGGHIAFSGSSDAATPVVLMTNRVGRGTLALDDGAFAFHDATA